MRDRDEQDCRGQQRCVQRQLFLPRVCLSLVHAAAGNLACTTEITRQAIEAIEQSGDRTLVFHCYAFRSYAEVCAGQFDAAENMAKCKAVAQEFGRRLWHADVVASYIAEVVIGKG